MIFNNFYHGKKVLITGHTGFKGSWLCAWLDKLGASVSGYSLPPPTVQNHFDLLELEMNHVSGDIRNLKHMVEIMTALQPDIVIHMAAQALVKKSYEDPVNTYSTNVMGVVNLLEAVRQTPSVKVVLNVTSDKCYENREGVWGYRENEPLGGYDPYSSSKGCSELITSAYGRSFLEEKGIGVATARAGNTIGGGDWADYRIIPDAVKAFTMEKPLIIRNPLAIRPWQHVLEPLYGYMLLCKKLYENPNEFSGSWNFGPREDDVRSVTFLSDMLVKLWGGNAEWLVDQAAHPHEALSLKLDCSKALSHLNWKPIWRIERALMETVHWYKAWYRKEEMADTTKCQIAAYEVEINDNG